jgi:PAS domain S-box-containing protein
MVHREDLAEVEKALQHAIKTHIEFHAEFRIIRADGAVRWIESFGRISYDDYRKAKRIIGVNSDITERKNTEEALRKSEFRFRRLVDSNIIPILVGRMEGITEANDAFLNMIGYTRAELVNGSIDWMKMTPPDHLIKDMEGLELLKTQGFCPPFEKEFVLKDGRRVPFLVGATVVDTSPLEWLCFVIDLSDLKRAEAELRKAHDELERKVRERTQELAETVMTLEGEMQMRKKTEQQLRELSARLLRLQDEERRRIARDLHDSTGQVLTALKIKLASIEAVVAEVPKAKALFDGSEQLAEQALQEIRTLSHLLHPPLLDEVGFSSAAQWYVEGLASAAASLPHWS